MQNNEFSGKKLGNDGTHWQPDDLLRKLYGLEPERGATELHLVACGECSGRWESLRLMRAEGLGVSTVGLVPERRLIEQRRALWARIDHPRRFWFSKWAPVAATSMLLAAGLVLLQPPQPIQSPAPMAGRSAAETTVSDAELFSDLSAMAVPSAPRAAEPIRALFEVAGSEDEGSF